LPWQGQFEGLALPVGGVGGAGLVEPPVDLGADQVRVGEQVGDVVPDDLVEVRVRGPFLVSDLRRAQLRSLRTFSNVGRQLMISL